MANRQGTGWVYSPEFLAHNQGLPHPECPERLAAITALLDERGLLAAMRPLDIAPASDDDLVRVHTRRHVHTIMTSEGRQFDMDTYCGPGTPMIARLAAGGVVGASLSVMNGEYTNAFCAVRPPGHHATAERPMGFCYFNNVAVAAAAVINAHPGARVLILDWDVHHGNGTQAVFYESAAVFYGSVHQYPFYPGTGGSGEIGRGEGRGFTLNKPLGAGAGNPEFLDAISSILEESIKAMPIDLVIISAGFDAHRDDPLANLNVTVEGFAEATRRVCSFADAHCQGRIVSVLEGGYNLRALADSVAAHVSILIETGTATQ